MSRIKIKETKDKNLFEMDYYDIEDPRAYIENIIDRFDILHNDMSMSEYTDKFVSSFLLQSKDNEITLDLCFNIPGGFDNITSRFRISSGTHKFDKFDKGIKQLLIGCRKFFKALREYEVYLRYNFNYKTKSEEILNYRLYIKQIDFCSSEILSRVSEEVNKLITEMIKNKRGG